jgi:heterodisulfide reductase subunit A
VLFFTSLPETTAELRGFSKDQESGMNAQKTKKPQGAVMVVGGGIAGMQSALDLADAGFFVHLVEKSPAIGGVMAQLDKTFPTNDCAM